MTNQSATLVARCMLDVHRSVLQPLGATLARVIVGLFKHGNRPENRVKLITLL